MKLPTACPKPPRRAPKERQPIARESEKAKARRLAGYATAAKQRNRPAAKNAARVKREFARTMHSAERVLFVQSRPCVISNAECRYYAGHSVNAHVVNDGSKGGSRKAGYRCITGLCDVHHYLLDNIMRRPEFEQRYGVDLQECADATERAWLASVEGNGG